MADKYCLDLELDKNICLTALKELQKHALEKLHDKEKYKETGIAVIKVKLSGFNSASTVSTTNKNDNPFTSRILSINIRLSSYTDSLQKAVSEQINVSPERLVNS